MRSLSIVLGAAALAGLALAAPRAAIAQSEAAESLSLRKAQDEFAKLQEALTHVNAEIADLKRGDRSVRNDYRLRDKMADAEALAQKLGRVEARLRSFAHPAVQPPKDGPLAPTPQALPQDGSVELEAKADLLADQASGLDKQADAFARAAEQLRTRQALRRRAGAWERDPFAGLESSKRNLAASAATQKYGAANPPGTSSGESGSRNGTGSTTLTPTTTTSSPSGSFGTPPSGGGTASDSAGKSSSGIGASESPASKSSPLAPIVGADHSVEQRLYLDPTTAAELRHLLASGGAGVDPESLDRAATALRKKARQLSDQADTLRRKSRAP